MQYVDPSVKYPPEWYVPGANTLTLERSPIHECWAEMEKLVEANLTRNIGVANFNCQAIMDMLTYAKIKPAVLQVICLLLISIEEGEKAMREGRD